MTMFSTKYPNNSRTVTGTPQLYNDDVILLCDTTSAPVIINLLEIAQGYWNTTWKLYIVDEANNAGTNNITINAGTGQLINNASSLVLDTNGADALVRIVSNTEFIATLSTGGSGDCCGITDLTNAEMLTLISTDTVVKSKLYRITDALFTNGGVVVQGIDVNKISREGRGEFYNADYQGVGDYSSVSGFTSQIGIWDSAKSATLNCVTIWNNNHYKNLTGAIGTAPNADNVNWEVLSRTLTNGFIYEVDFVKYDVDTNEVIYRADKLLNEVDLAYTESVNTMTTFPWGNNNVFRNKVTGQTTLGIYNSNGTIKGNIIESSSVSISSDYDVSGSSTIDSNTILSSSQLTLVGVRNIFENNTISNASSLTLFNTPNDAHETVGNTITNASQVTINDMVSSSSAFETNTITNASTLTINELSSGFRKNTLSNRISLTIITISAQFYYNTMAMFLTVTIPSISSSTNNLRLESGFSNFFALLDMNLVYAAGTITIPTALNYCGIFLFENATAIGTTTKIENLPSTHPCTLTPAPAPGNTLVFATTPIGTPAVTNEIVANTTNAGTATLVNRTSGQDFIVVTKVGGLNVITEKNEMV